MSESIPWSLDAVSYRLDEVEQRLKSDDQTLRHVFTETFFDDARAQLNNDDQNAHRENDSALNGALVSVKDLLDVKGYVTRAGTRFMAEDSPASIDAPAIQQLRDAGAILVGHTNMTELAFSGLGLNPHYGTPENALYPGCIPGGSSSGGAISVAQGAADIAIGTDTGGSVRIPAAFNGIVGFKPTQSTVSRVGCKPLSVTLDSIGPMAKSVAHCKLAYQAMSKSAKTISSELTSDELAPTFIIPDNYGMDDLEAPVRSSFENSVALLKANGYSVVSKTVKTLDELKTFAIWHFAAVESRGAYDDAYHTQRDIMDPRITGPTRMGRADGVDAVSYRKTLNKRSELVEQFKHELGNAVLLLPTVPILPPTFAAFTSDDNYTRINTQVLRNTTIGNVLDCCSVSLPHTHAGATIGVMLTACANQDFNLLALAQSCEGILS